MMNITERAMLVRLRISQFNPERKDAAISDEVAKLHGIDATMGKYMKSIIDKGAVAKLRTLAGNIRKEHARRTLPWADDGSRMLTTAGYLSYAECMRDFGQQWDTELMRFLDGWDEFVADARLRLNGTFNPADYPTKSSLRAKFAFRWIVRPVPNAPDFRVNLGAMEIAEIKRQLETETAEVTRAAMRDVWARMQETVKRMAERLRAYNPEHPREHPFRDSLVGNVNDLLDVLPSLNLTGDSNMAQFCDEMRKLTRYDVDALRDNFIVRDEVATTAESILAKMSQFIA